MSVSYRMDDTTKVFEIGVAGKVTQEDFDSVIKPFQAFIDRHGTVKLIEIIPELKGFEPSMIWSGIKFDVKNLKHISHVAVVSDIAWLTPLSKAAGSVISTQLTTFNMDQIDEARTWIAQA